MYGIENAMYVCTMTHLMEIEQKRQAEREERKAAAAKAAVEAAAKAAAIKAQIVSNALPIVGTLKLAGEKLRNPTAYTKDGSLALQTRSAHHSPVLTPSGDSQPLNGFFSPMARSAISSPTLSRMGSFQAGTTMPGPACSSAVTSLQSIVRGRYSPTASDDNATTITMTLQKRL